MLASCSGTTGGESTDASTDGRDAVVGADGRADSAKNPDSGNRADGGADAAKGADGGADTAASTDASDANGPGVDATTDADATGADAGSDAMTDATGSDAVTDAAGADAESDVGSDAAPGTDAGVDADAAVGADAGSDAEAGPADSGTPNACAEAGAACSLQGADGICQNGVCSTCTDVTDDSACKAAYPPASVCLQGVCTPGNCRTDSDCSAGQICGVGQPNFCGDCTSDSQCQGDPTYSTTAPVCNIAQGTCGSAACSNDHEACTANPTDLCCSGTCVPGNCCTDADCKGSNQTCQSHQCTTCALVTNSVYYVDPKNGNDSAATGSSATGACAFKTVTRALQFIGPSPTANTKIEVMNTAAVSAETFPMAVPTNVTIEGGTAGAPTVIDVAANKAGFWLASPASGLSNLIVDGAKLAGTSGIQVHSGSSATTTLTNLEVRNMAVNGIQTNGACQIAIGTGVASHDNGRAGLSVNGTSVVTVTIDTGDTAATFNDNGAHGIYVGGSGSLTITGTAASTAVTQGNGNAGLLIMQTPGGTGAASVTSFTASGTTNGNGITIYGGSSLTLRDSITQGNSADGVLVATYQQGTTTSSDVSLIDLGTPASYGGNTFQFKTGESPNLGTGICLQVGPNAGQNLHAAGNIFEDKDCAITPAILQKSALCADATDYGIADPGTTHPNAIDLAQCGCLATGKNCTESSSCCSESCDARGSTCDSCMGAGLSCAKGSDCCSGTCDGNGACDSCIAVTYTCGQNSDCCSGNCQDHTCEA